MESALTDKTKVLIIVTSKEVKDLYDYVVKQIAEDPRAIEDIQKTSEFSSYRSSADNKAKIKTFIS